MFKTMTSVLDKRKTPSIDEILKIQSYVFCRWLTGSPKMVSVANDINRFDKIPIQNQYLLVKHQFAGKINYVPYPKKGKTNNARDVEIIQDMLKLSTDKAIDYLKYISQDELKMLVTQYELRRSRK